MNRIEKSNTTSKPTAATPPHGLKIKAAVTPHAGQDRVMDLWRHIKRVDDVHHELDQQSVAAYQKDERKHKLLGDQMCFVEEYREALRVLAEHTSARTMPDVAACLFLADEKCGLADDADDAASLLTLIGELRRLVMSCLPVVARAAAVDLAACYGGGVIERRAAAFVEAVVA